MTASKTQINERMNEKTNPALAETIWIAKKNNLVELAYELSLPSRKQAAVNLSRINEAKTENAIVPGKVLSVGEINKKINVYALAYSKAAKEKLKKAGCPIFTILEGLKKNNKLKGEIIK